MKIAQNKVVTMHYKLTDKEGAVIDSSEGRDPSHQQSFRRRLRYSAGDGNIERQQRRYRRRRCADGIAVG